VWQPLGPLPAIKDVGSLTELEGGSSPPDALGWAGYNAAAWRLSMTSQCFAMRPVH
jgi:hypothetical protein